jgi:hypothetical protein
MGKRQRTEENDGKSIALEDIKEEPEAVAQEGFNFAEAAPLAIHAGIVAPVPKARVVAVAEPTEEDEDDLEEGEKKGGQVDFDFVLRKFAEVMKAEAAGMSIGRISEMARDLGALYELYVGMNRNINCATAKRQKIANSGTTLLQDLTNRE